MCHADIRDLGFVIIIASRVRNTIVCFGTTDSVFLNITSLGFQSVVFSGVFVALGNFSDVEEQRNL